jgi:hypothetical protein
VGSRARRARPRSHACHLARRSQITLRPSTPIGTFRDGSERTSAVHTCVGGTSRRRWREERDRVPQPLARGGGSAGIPSFRRSPCFSRSPRAAQLALAHRRSPLTTMGSSRPGAPSPRPEVIPIEAERRCWTNTTIVRHKAPGDSSVRQNSPTPRSNGKTPRGPCFGARRQKFLGRISRIRLQVTRQNGQHRRCHLR